MGVVSACLPTLRPIWTRYNRYLSSTTTSIPMKSFSGRKYRFGGSHRRIPATSNEQDETTLTNECGVDTYIEADKGHSLRTPMENAIAVERDMSCNSEPMGA